MGNCLTCFKEPTSTALDSAPQSGCKEEMPEARLYPAPSHVPASSAPPPESILSNGNHLSAQPLVQDHHHVTAPSSAAAAASLSAAAANAATPGAATASSGVISRFYNPCARRAHSRSAPAMGAADSRPSDAKLAALFDVYRDAHEDVILAEGIVQLCKDLQVSPDDFKILVLAWKLEAEQMCRFSRAEFVNGLRSIRADSIKAVQQRLPELVAEVAHSPEQFKDLYKFTFKFGLEQSQRILPTTMATVLWRLVFTVREPPILQRWLNFLECHQGSIRGITKDTWNMFLNFSDAVGGDLSSYDDTEAWPSLFDDFVEFENDQANQNISKDLAKDDNHQGPPTIGQDDD